MKHSMRHGLLLAAAACAAAFSCTVTNQKKKTGNGPVESPGPVKKFQESELDTAENINDYAAFCKQELGLPEATLDPWYCLEGSEIPVTIDGKQPTAENYEEMKKTRSGCDIGSWLGDQPCANYAFVQERALSDDVRAIFLCRMRTFTNHLSMTERKSLYTKTPTEENFRSLYQFDSIGLLWTNKKTGHTCYYDYVGESYGGFVLSPDDKSAPLWANLPEPKPPKTFEEQKDLRKFWEKSAVETWKTPKEVAETDNCVRCHDSGPYKSSPWIEQAFDVPNNDPKVPHIVVGQVFDTWRKRFPMVAISTAPIEKNGVKESQVCSSCHRIGSQATCDEFIGFSIGKSSPAELSDLGKSFFYRTWMPPSPQEWHGKLESELSTLWAHSYEHHVARLQCCCNNPKAKGCTTQQFDTFPIPKIEAGKGPGICP